MLGAIVLGGGLTLAHLQAASAQLIGLGEYPDELSFAF